MAYGFCILSPLLFFGRHFLAGRMVFQWDTFSQFWPWRYLWVHYIGKGTFPLWNPYQFSGMPFLGDPQMASLYPLNIVFLFLPSLEAMQVYILLMYSLFAAFTYLYARTIGLSRFAALVSTTACTYSLHMVAHCGHATRIHTAIWLPLQLTLVEKIVGTQRYRHIVLLALVVAIQVFAGHPQILFFSMLILGSYMLAHLVAARQDRWQAGVGFLLALVVGLCWGAPQLLPGTELAIQSSRHTSPSYERFSSYSLAPQMLIQLIFPFFYRAPSDVLYQLRTSIDPWTWETIFYIGIIPLLSVISLATVPKRTDWREGFWLLVFLWGVTFAFGKFNPFYSLVYRLPVYRWFQVAGMHVFPASWAAAIIAGLRIGNLLRGSTRALLITFGTFVVLCLGLLFVNLQQYDRLASIYVDNALRPELIVPLACIVVSFILLWLFRGSSGRKYVLAKGTLLFVLVADLLATSGTVAVSVPGSIARALPQKYVDLKASIQPREQRIWQVNSKAINNGYLFAPLRFATSYNPLILERYQRLTRIGDYGIAPFVPDSRVLDLLNVGYIAVRRVLLQSPLSSCRGDMASPQCCGRVVEGYCFSMPGYWVELTPGSRIVLDLGQGEPIHGLGLISAMSRALDAKDGESVAEIQLYDQAGIALATWLVRAGTDTAEWAYELPDGRAQHSMPKIVDSWAQTTPAGQPFHGHNYFSSIGLDQNAIVTRVIITNTTSKNGFILCNLSLQSSTGDTIAYPLNLAQVQTPLCKLPELSCQNSDLAIFQRQPALGYAWPVERVETLDANLFLEAVHGWLHESNLDLKKVAYIEIADQSQYQFSSWLLETHFDPEAQVLPLNLGFNDLTLRVRADGPAFVVLSEIYYPGWNVYVDGLRTELYRVNYLLRGFSVLPGIHEVQMRYEPLSFYLGLAIAAVGCLLLLGFLLIHKARVQPPRLKPN
jgi:hypothetical protein